MRLTESNSYNLPDGYRVESRCYGPDFNIGSVDKRQFSFDVVVPFSMQVWRGGSFRFSWLKMLNPLNWWKSATRRSNWRCNWKRFRDMTHRCYCPTGSSADGSIVLSGFGIVFWYSRYTGEVPCWCDKVLEEMENERSVT